jgi:hypothetical protein
MSDALKPSYNHTRSDGPFDPCPICLQLMSRAELIEYASDLDMRVKDLADELSKPTDTDGWSTNMGRDCQWRAWGPARATRAEAASDVPRTNEPNLMSRLFSGADVSRPSEASLVECVRCSLIATKAVPYCDDHALQLGNTTVPLQRPSDAQREICNLLCCDPKAPQLRCLRMKGHDGPGDAWSSELSQRTNEDEGLVLRNTTARLLEKASNIDLNRADAFGKGVAAGLRDAAHEIHEQSRRPSEAPTNCAVCNGPLPSDGGNNLPDDPIGVRYCSRGCAGQAWAWMRPRAAAELTEAERREARHFLAWLPEDEEKAVVALAYRFRALRAASKSPPERTT